MKESADIATLVILSGMGMLILIGVAVMLLITVHTRRIRQEADLLQLRMKHAEEVRETEREAEAQTLRELGQELHDNVGQLLTAVRMDANSVIKATDQDPIALGMRDTLDTAIAEIRRLSHTLIADRLRERPLAEAMEEECRRLNRPGLLEVVFRAEGSGPELPPDRRVVLYRIFQECMNNALKHARADRISVVLGQGPASLRFTDNGVGFDGTLSAGTGEGLSSIRRRAELIGLRCHVDSSPGQGTTITVAP